VPGTMAHSAPGIDPDAVIVSILLFLAFLGLVIYKHKDKILGPSRKAADPEEGMRLEIEQLRQMLELRTDERPWAEMYAHIRNPYAPDTKPSIKRISVADLSKKPWECRKCCEFLTIHLKEEFEAHKCDVCARKRDTNCGVCKAEFERREDTVVRRILEWFQRVLQRPRGAVAYLKSLLVGLLKLVQKQWSMEVKSSASLRPWKWRRSVSARRSLGKRRRPSRRREQPALVAMCADG
jgi:hypothetical protein